MFQFSISLFLKGSVEFVRMGLKCYDPLGPIVVLVV
jgi:hypothetical protein